jgi:Putative Flp pilus-assembly TadE/G-like
MRERWTPLQKLVGCESGQSLVVISLSMVVMLGMAALGIDVASWYTKHHQTQVVADSAALAAANCLAHPNTGPSGSSCSSNTDTTDATNVAVAYAAANGIKITASQVVINTTTDRVTVNPSATTPSTFASVLGIHSTSEAATATASFAQPGAQPCGTPGQNCDFMFADNSNCSSSSNGIDFNASGNSTIEGVIQSNGNISGAASGNQSWGTATYGPNGTSVCSNSVVWSGHDPWTTEPTQATSDVPFPIDYTQDFPACGTGTGEIACQSTGSPLAPGYPSFCTNGGASITLNGSTNGDTAITNQIYCASGTGNPAEPSTWNGSITIDLSGKNTLYDTFVGGTISFDGSGNDTLSSCGYTTSGYTAADCASTVPAPTTSNYPIFYATGTSSTALTVNVSGSQTLNGDLFAPNGTANLNMSGNKTLTTFIEGLDINANVSGTMLGDGPTAGTSGSSGAGSDYLVQ